MNIATTSARLEGLIYGHIVRKLLMLKKIEGVGQNLFNRPRLSPSLVERF